MINGIVVKRLFEKIWIIFYPRHFPSTYGHRLKNNQHPVRSAKDKLQIDQLVVGWVTTSEYWLLYVLIIIFFGRSSAGENDCVLTPST